MTAATLPAWQKRRSALNHDWLKNRFIPALAKWLNLLDDEVEDPDFELAFLRTVLPQWAERRADIRALLDDFEWQMSPVNLLPEESDDWLIGLVHALWLQRRPVRCWVDEAGGRFADVNRAYQELLDQLRLEEPHEASAWLRPLRPAFARFCECCQRLARCLEVFPSEIRIP